MNITKSNLIRAIIFAVTRICLRRRGVLWNKNKDTEGEKKIDNFSWRYIRVGFRIEWLSTVLNERYRLLYYVSAKPCTYTNTCLDMRRVRENEFKITVCFMGGVPSRYFFIHECKRRSGTAYINPLKSSLHQSAPAECVFNARLPLKRITR